VPLQQRGIQIHQKEETQDQKEKQEIKENDENKNEETKTLPENLEIDHPLFKSKPISNEDVENDDTLLALQNLVFEGTPKEIAENFKEQGNECFKKGTKFYKNAIAYYTQGIKQEFDDKELMSTLYANRAAVNMQLENFGRVVEDCLESIKILPNVKALYRLSKAYFSLKNYDDAIHYSEEGIKIEETNKTFKKLIKDCKVEKNKIEQRLKKERRVKEEKDRKRELVKTAIHIKGIIVGAPVFSNIKTFLEKSSVTLDGNNLTHWPVLFVYEEYHIIDFIKDFCEEETFGDHLQKMFPGDEFPDWDSNKKYVHSLLEIYSIVNHTTPVIEESKERKRKRKVKLNQTTKLIKILQHPEYVVPGIPVFYIFRKETPTKSTFLTTHIDELGNYEE